MLFSDGDHSGDHDRCGNHHQYVVTKYNLKKARHQAAQTDNQLTYFLLELRPYTSQVTNTQTI